MGRAAGAVGLVLLVVAWPRLGGAAPALPADEAVPVAPAPEVERVEPPGPARGRAPRLRSREPRRTAPVRERDARRERDRAPAAVAPPARLAPQPPAVSPPPSPALAPPPPPAPTIDPAEREFGFER